MTARRYAALIIVGCLLCAPCDASGQASPLVLEVHGGSAVPIRDFAYGIEPGEGAVRGSSLGVDLALSGAGWRTVYIGFSQHRFGCEAAGCASGEEYIATGFHAGFRASLRFVGGVSPWLRIGAVTTRVEVPALAGSAEGLSRLGLGAELGAGLYIGVSSPVALVPGVRVVVVDTELPGGATLGMRYAVVDVALAFAF